MSSFGKDIRQKEFTFEEDVCFINHGAHGAVPKRVQEARKIILDEIDSHPEKWYRHTRKKKWIAARNAIANFVNANPEDLVFIENVTTGVNTILRSIRFRPDDIILYTNQSYPGVQKACQATARFSDIRSECLHLEYPVHADEEIVKQYVEYFEKNPNVRLVIIDHIICFSGLKMPVEKLVMLCNEHGILCMIDGAHAAGQVHLDIESLNADFYTGNLYKWLYTPRGCAILHVKRIHHDLIFPVVTSIGYQMSLTDSFINQGTRDDSAYSVVPESIHFHRKIGGFEKLHEYAECILSKVVPMLTSSWKTDVLVMPEDMKAPCISVVRLPELPGYTLPEDEHILRRLFHQRCKEYNVVSSFVVIDSVFYCRLCVNVYNTLEDYCRLDKAILDLVNTSSKNIKSQL
ncbi:hercynylcysteine sulfoxide lyase [Mytilus galloprovincialis]|uniref:Hercynylcysteine sulfoxide lyase n=1 Tax=Mytilus galloprovincialis TaxID=29158 RepID=A0A8B6BKM2_MYTGA|nr:hercynylcysteine sulfoxide lyase [Mytilus galloprovincialis]